MYEGENGKYLSYSDARKEHWKCDKLLKILNCLEIIRLDRTPINQSFGIQIPYQILLLTHSNGISW